MQWTPPPKGGAGRLLVLQGWPYGFCPVHVYEHMQCSAKCLPTRRDFAEAARELDEHWRDVARESAPAVRAAA